MASNKLHEKDLKRPDRFQVLGIRFLNWILKAKSTLIGAGLLVVFAGIAFAAWNVWSNKNTDERRNELAAIEKLYSDEAAKVSEQADKLRQEIQTLEQLDQMKPADQKPADSTASNAVAERRKVIESQIQAMKPDHSESLAKFRAFHEKNATKREGALAGMRAANILLANKNKVEAEKILMSLVDKAKGEVFYQYQARLSLIGIWQDDKRFEDAIKAADELVTIAGEDDALKAQSLLVKGNVLVTKGDKTAAFSTYDELIKQFPDSREAKRAQSMKAIL